ncbi:MAG: efflux RND transporter periplasmic adaptor subunit [Vicinamibacterales bacterium]
MSRTFTHAGAAVLAVLATACATPEPAAKETAPAAQASAQPGTAPATTASVALTGTAMSNAGVTLATVETATTSGDVSVPGVVLLDDTRTARVGSLQEGLVLKTLVQVGDQVKAGQLLATMHGHAMHDAWAGYRKALADRQRLETELAYAVDAHERAERLFAAKAIAQQEVRRAAMERDGAGQRLAAARAEVTRAIEELEHVGVHVSKLTGEIGAREADADEEIPVRTPTGGVVLERLVTPGTTVVPGAALYTISDLTSLWVVVELDETYLPLVRTGRAAGIRVAAYPGQIFPGTVTFIGDSVNPRTRRVTLRVSVGNRDRRLKPDMFATVSLATHEPRQMLTVPRAAVQSIDGRPTVFVAEAGGRFSPRTVTAGAEQDGRVEIVAGLTAGERVVASGGFALKSELLAPARGE